jgi:hypothetical protein
LAVQLNPIASIPASSVPAAIVIKELQPNQRHVGIVFLEGENGNYSLAHLPWHHQPLRGTLENGYFWVQPKSQFVADFASSRNV